MGLMAIRYRASPVSLSWSCLWYLAMYCPSQVNVYAQPVLNVYIKPDKPVKSYLTPLTGLTKEKLDTDGVSEADAIAGLRRFLNPQCYLVGMNIRKDIQWLGLESGKDFAECIDLAALFRVSVTRGHVKHGTRMCMCMYVCVRARSRGCFGHLSRWEAQPPVPSLGFVRFQFRRCGTRSTGHSHTSASTTSLSAG